ncbi:tetratricopeptide repeat protein [Shewanella putrefaciens]|uniref:tetratricopeptide repeat protein n=1 Tax=Shewanella putrefaciens TaxID=24 RepID=UPI00242CB9D7|nr:tetratricopeptide repeat protein [Shewanella putrefaciens]MCA1897288.1 tetratricopeptide repeat protein [Shewanella putrefaciens]
MSVINKMLKDLDQRQQGHQLSNIAQHQVQYLGRKHSVNIWVSISLMSLLIGGVGVYGYQLISQMPVEPAPKFAAASETEVAIMPTVPEINAEAETITSEAVNVTEPLALSKKTVVKASNGLVNTEMPLDEGSHPVAKQNAQIEATVTANAQSEPQTIVTEEDEIVEAIQASAPEREFVKSSVDTPTIEPVKPAGKMAVTEVKLTPSQLAQKQLTLATDAEKQGKLDKALEYYEKALGFDPSLHNVRQQLAALHYGQGRLNNAEQVLQQAVLLYPQEFEFYLLLARVQQELGEVDLALASLAQIPDSHVLARQKWLAQTDLAQKQGQFTLAEQAYRQLLQQEPQQGKWWMGLGYALDSQQQFAKASQAYRTALSHSGLSAQATAFIEQRLSQLGDSQ